jgi:tripartite-type tricarboxylate transporter receptor subunit TctC
VVAGEIDMMVADLTPALPHAKNNRLRLLAVAGAKRASAAPDLPTMLEAGVKMQPIDGRYGILAPAGTPREIINRLHGAIVAALKQPDVTQRFQQLGSEVVGDTPEQFAETIKTQSENLAPVVKKAGIKVN